jgi:hypothetical protein
MKTFVVTYNWGEPQRTVRLHEFNSAPVRISREQARAWIDRPGQRLFSLSRVGEFRPAEDE